MGNFQFHYSVLLTCTTKTYTIICSETLHLIKVLETSQVVTFMKININNPGPCNVSTAQNGLRTIVQCEISAKNILLTDTGHDAHGVYCVVGHPQS